MSSLYNILIIFHIVISFSLLLLIVFQKTSGEGLLTSSNKSNFMSMDEVASFLTKLTYIFTIIFVVNTICIATIGSRVSRSLNLVMVEKIKSENTPTK